MSVRQRFLSVVQLLDLCLLLRVHYKIYLGVGRGGLQNKNQYPVVNVLVIGASEN